MAGGPYGLRRPHAANFSAAGFVGRCVTLGPAEGFPALDAPQGEEIHRLDHLAQYCLLSAKK